MSAADRRQGRGRLSSIDTLPEDAEEDVVWALEALRERKLPQSIILEEFNARLIAKDIDPISKSAFNRYAVRKAIQFRKMDEVRRISSELVDTLGTDEPDDVTVLVAEMIKVSLFRILEDRDAGPKEVMEMARALQATVSAQRGSEEYRKQLEKRVAQQLEEAADRAEVKMREAGLPADRIAQLRRDFLGVKS